MRIMGRLAVEGSGRLLGRTYHLRVFRVSAEHQAYELLGAQNGCGKSGGFGPERSPAETTGSAQLPGGFDGSAVSDLPL